jgi:hypothetical protein
MNISPDYAVQSHTNLLEIESKRKLLLRLDQILTPEFKSECPGLAIMVLSVNEYEVVMNALNEVSRRKKRILHTAPKIENVSSYNKYSNGLTLNIIDH